MANVSRCRLMKVKVKCPGKVILFGEHASVYGFPALVTTVSAYTQVEIERLIEPVIRYEAPAFDFKLECKVTLFEDVAPIKDGESEKKACQQIRHILSQKQSLQSVTEESWFLLLYFYHKMVPLSDRFGIKVTATTQLWPGAGMGSSASYCCSLAMGLLTLCGGDTSIDNVNKIAYEGEKVFHGTPSGVDNTACSLGGCLMYSKLGHEQFTPKTTPRLLVINSKQAHNTAAIVQQVRRQSNRLQDVFQRIGEIAREGERRLRAGEDISALITENHNLLNKLPGVPHHRTDDIVQICREYGVAAKITGAGGGGVVLGLLPGDTDNNRLDNMIDSLKKAGYQVLSNLEIAVPGVELVTAQYSL